MTASYNVFWKTLLYSSPPCVCVCARARVCMPMYTPPLNCGFAFCVFSYPQQTMVWKRQWKVPEVNNSQVLSSTPSELCELSPDSLWLRMNHYFVQHNKAISATSLVAMEREEWGERDHCIFMVVYCYNCFIIIVHLLLCLIYKLNFIIGIFTWKTI